MITDTSFQNAMAFCINPELVENYELAKNDPDNRYIIHHKLGLDKSREELKKEGKYWHAAVDECIWMEYGEHTTLHNKHRREESRKKMRENNSMNRQEVRDKVRDTKIAKNPVAKFMWETYGITGSSNSGLYHRLLRHYRKYGSFENWTIN